MWVRILMVPGAGIEPARLAARDFESRASTYSAIPATRASDYYRFRFAGQALKTPGAPLM